MTGARPRPATNGETNDWIAFHELLSWTRIGGPASNARRTIWNSSWKRELLIEDVRVKGTPRSSNTRRNPQRAFRAVRNRRRQGRDRRGADQLDRGVVEALEHGADNIRRYHQEQLPGEMWMRRFAPAFSPRALYADRQRDLFSARQGFVPSVTLMGAIPAVVAGVPDPIVLTWPDPMEKYARRPWSRPGFPASSASTRRAASWLSPRPRSEPKPCRNAQNRRSRQSLADGGERLLADKIIRGCRRSERRDRLRGSHRRPRLAAMDLLTNRARPRQLRIPGHDLARRRRGRSGVADYWAKMGKRWVEHSTAVLGGENGGWFS